MGHRRGDGKGVGVGQCVPCLDRRRFEHPGLGRQIQGEPVAEVADDRSRPSAPVARWTT